MSEPFLHDIFDETVVTDDGLIADMIKVPESTDDSEKSFIPLLRNQEAIPRKKSFKLGRLGSPPQAPYSGLTDKICEKLSYIGRKAIVHDKNLRDSVTKNWSKIPKPLRFAVAGFVKLAYEGYYEGNRYLREIAIAKGLKPEDAIRVARIASAFEFAQGNPRTGTTMTMLGLPDSLQTSSMLPVGSLTCLAFSTSKYPQAMLKHAKEIVNSRVQQKKDRIKFFSEIDGKFWEVKFNPNHAPAGSEEGGQFTANPEGVGKGEGKLEQKNGFEEDKPNQMSGAEVTLTSQNGQGSPNMQVVTDIFGEHDNIEEVLATAVAAPDDSSVKVLVGKGTSASLKYVIVRTDGDGLHSSRHFEVDKDGNKYVENYKFELGEKGTGKGTEIFARQVGECAKLGFSYIKCEAYGQYKTDMNGYYTWPRLGYDAKISLDSHNSVLAKAKQQFPDAESVLDVMATKGGKEWWKENGGTFDAKFDLKEGSRSRQALNAYLQERAKRSKT
jgi:hypothetical protein